MRVGCRPGERFPLRLKEAIDDERISFGSISTAGSRGASIDNVGTGIDGQTGEIGKEDFGAVRDFSRIDGAMACAEPCSIPAGALARSGVVPINGDTSQ